MDNPEHAEAQAIAEEQAAKDAALMAVLQEKRRVAKDTVLDMVHSAEDEEDQQPFTVTMDRAPMNRAQRRAQVQQYARILAETERQTPVVNPTIIPKSARRQRKGSRYAH